MSKSPKAPQPRTLKEVQKLASALRGERGVNNLHKSALELLISADNRLPCRVKPCSPTTYLQFERHGVVPENWDSLTAFFVALEMTPEQVSASRRCLSVTTAAEVGIALTAGGRRVPEAAFAFIRELPPQVRPFLTMDEYLGAGEDPDLDQGMIPLLGRLRDELANVLLRARMAESPSERAAADAYANASPDASGIRAIDDTLRQVCVVYRNALYRSGHLRRAMAGDRPLLLGELPEERGHRVRNLACECTRYASDPVVKLAYLIENLGVPIVHDPRCFVAVERTTVSVVLGAVHDFVYQTVLGSRLTGAAFAATFERRIRAGDPSCMALDRESRRARAALRPDAEGLTLLTSNECEDRFNDGIEAMADSLEQLWQEEVEPGLLNDCAYSLVGNLRREGLIDATQRSRVLDAIERATTRSQGTTAGRLLSEFRKMFQRGRQS